MTVTNPNVRIRRKLNDNREEQKGALIEAGLDKSFEALQASPGGANSPKNPSPTLNKLWTVHRFRLVHDSSYARTIALGLKNLRFAQTQTMLRAATVARPDRVGSQPPGGAALHPVVGQRLTPSPTRLRRHRRPAVRHLVWNGRAAKAGQALCTFPNDSAVIRLVGAMLLEHNDELSLNRLYMQLEGMQTLGDTAPTRLSAVQCR